MPTLRGMARGLASTHHPRAWPTLTGKQREARNPPLKERRHTRFLGSICRGPSPEAPPGTALPRPPSLIGRRIYSLECPPSREATEEVLRSQSKWGGGLRAPPHVQTRHCRQAQTEARAHCTATLPATSPQQGGQPEGQRDEQTWADGQERPVCHLPGTN